MTFLLCDPGWYVNKSDFQKKWDKNRHTTVERCAKVIRTLRPTSIAIARAGKGVRVQYTVYGMIFCTVLQVQR